MNKIKTKELAGIALDWVVTKCELPEGWPIILGEATDYSTEWALAGPIIERERIELRGDGDGGWIAYDNLTPEKRGSTPLIAAMLCYVASVMGDEIEVPDELA